MSQLVHVVRDKIIPVNDNNNYGNTASYTWYKTNDPDRQKLLRKTSSQY